MNGSESSMCVENKKKQFMVVNERLRNLSKAIENLEDFVGTLMDGTPPEKSEDSGPMEKETFGSVWCSLPRKYIAGGGNNKRR